MHRPLDYDRVAGAYDRRYVENEYPGIERAVLDFAGELLHGCLLEVGCGTGHWLALLTDRGVRTAGVDRSAAMLGRARHRNAALVRARAEQLPWSSGSFDRVICVNALHHFTDKPAFLAEASRVLRPGGSLMTIGLDPHTGSDRWCVYDYFETTLELDRRRFPASAQLRAWMSEAGFSACSTQETEHLVARHPARAALEQGRLDKTSTSQLAVLSDEQYTQGLNRIRHALQTAEAQGEPFDLVSDLRLYATYGQVEG
jgi:SAM-dependent methyltransferase